MAAARKKPKSPARFLWLGKLIAPVRGPAGPFVYAALMVLGLAGAWWLVWLKVGPRVLSSEEYVVEAGQVEITPLPEWIHADIRAEVFRTIDYDAPLSILDERLAERVAHAFALNPWVARVVRVTKQPPARLEVELVYRRPVCMVEVPGELLQAEGHAKLLPVDVHGVLLPHARDDFSPVEKGRYPRLVGIDTAPVGVAGEYWGDPRVAAGAEIAAALAEVWDEFHFKQIVPSPRTGPGPTGDPVYTLVTRGGARIIWGRAPGTDAPGEPSVAEKIALLRRYVRRHGGLDGLAGERPLDLYRLRTSSRGAKAPHRPTRLGRE